MTSGRAERSLWSSMRAITTMTTPTSEFSWPKAAENPAMKMTITAKNTVLPAIVLTSIVILSAIKSCI